MITHTRAGRAGLFFAGITGVALGLLSVQARAEQASTPAKDPNEILFEKGMKALRDDRLVSAIEAFRTILSNAPDLHRARLELALAYYRSLAYEKARKAAERVLKDPTVPPNVRVTVLAFLAQVKEDQKRLSVKNHFTPSISFGLMYDSNVNIGPISDVVQIGNQSLVIAPGSRPKSDSATVFSAGLVHRYQPGKRFRAGQRVGQFLWQSEVDLYHRAYFSEHDYNLSVLSASTGPAWVVPRHWRA
ncbi:MAG TPA: hypothetical protein VKA14_04645, partial [Gammaproteobacteria bacterium]|nr:hypothetical protein [Gammaproteobacteria bacterium]